MAIGKEGQNVRLAARVSGWKIDIKSHGQYFGEDGEDGEYFEEYDDAELAPDTTEEIKEVEEVTEE